MDAETLASLERAAKMLTDEAISVECSSHHEYSQKAAAQMDADAATIRALIKRERRGGERAKVVAYAKAQDDAWQASLAEHRAQGRSGLAVLPTWGVFARAIEAGAHEEQQP